MKFYLAVEDVEPNHWVAYVLGLPGSFSAAPNPEDAVSQAPQRIMDYFAWLSRHNVTPTVNNLPLEIVTQLFLKT